jgi:hypothetical protein
VPLHRPDKRFRQIPPASRHRKSSAIIDSCKRNVLAPSLRESGVHTWNSHSPR